MITSVTVIGLGNMGRGMALTLHKAGFQVQGSDIDSAARERLSAEGIDTAAPDALAPSDVYLLSLPTSAHVSAVLEKAPGLLAKAPRGSLIVDTSTSDPVESRQLAAKVIAAGLEWLDAPVSGGPSGAHSGQLGMLVGGQATTLERARPLLDAMTKNITHVGEAGSGHVVKLANNYLCAAHLLTTAEAVAMAQRAGVDPAACLAGLNSGSGRSAVSEVNFPRWILDERFDSGFSLGLMRKDLRLAHQTAQQLSLDDGLLERVRDAWHDERLALEDDDDFNRITVHLLEAARQYAADQPKEDRT
ncbi:3-hydroxyisobutyrate dehydrogenase [Franzmannia pantelleriensis]|uniref:3-hydroxyisobutyrate dehydrogenase n=1 Tax=Franzmannia pantelleriensis TaxID=48727 RepID=A0A1G9EGQ8_9GAMM|nr:NAD(P)-dependent oxidoreductase [Halomonas pantelleriensis]SDK75306.1 3-hydroxyisobutyrate dehydrogenase [Halomonas pantelleriensis]